MPTAELPVLPQRDQVVEDRYRHESHLLELSYAGGVDGMETTLRLLVELPRILSERGVAYVLLCAQNKPEEVKKAIPMLLTGEWTVDTVGDSGRKAGWEKLVIIRIARSQTKFVSFISLIARTLLISQPIGPDPAEVECPVILQLKIRPCIGVLVITPEALPLELCVLDSLLGARNRFQGQVHGV